MTVCLYEDKSIVIGIITSSIFNNFSYYKNENIIYHINLLIDYSFELCMLYGKVFLSDDRKACALLFYPEFGTNMPKVTSLDLNWMLHYDIVEDGVKAMRLTKKIELRRPRIKMACLKFIGAIPKYQTFGLAKRIMSQLIILTKQEKHPIYLETSCNKALAWFKKFGFEVYYELDMGYKLYFLRLPL